MSPVVIHVYKIILDYACQSVSTHRKPMALYRSPNFSFSVLFCLGSITRACVFFYMYERRKPVFREHVIAHLFFFIWLLSFIEIEANLNLYRSPLCMFVFKQAWEFCLGEKRWTMSYIPVCCQPTWISDAHKKKWKLFIYPLWVLYFYRPKNKPVN